MDGPGGSGEVVAIGARSAFRPGYKQLASGQVLAARERLGTDHGEFAAYLGTLLGWRVTPEAVEHWEHGSTPPGDVLLACAVITHDAPGRVLVFPQGADAGHVAALLSEAGRGLAGTVLQPVPHAFPASALAGPWVSAYEFRHGADVRHHADIVHVVAVSEHHVRAVNHPPEPRTEGRAAPFRNELEAQLAGRHLIGHWRNTNDTRYFGALELAVQPGEMVMDGYYLGVASDIHVSTGLWRWVRLAPGDADVAALELRDPAAVHEAVMGHSEYGAALTPADIGEDT